MVFILSQYKKILNPCRYNLCKLSYRCNSETYMIAAALIILFVITFGIFIVNRVFPHLGYSWFLAIGGCVISAILIFFSYTSEPYEIHLMKWEELPSYPFSPHLIVDSISWSFAVAIIILATSVLLTDIARVQEIDPSAWAFGIGLTGLGIFTVLAGGPVTLLLGWASIDMVETYLRFVQINKDQDRESIVVHLLVRVFGWVLVVLATIRSQGLGLSLEFSDIPVESSGYLILAAGLRLGVLPPHPPFLKDRPIRRGLGTLVRLVPVSVSLVLLTRAAMVGVTSAWGVFLLLSSALVVVYGGINWFGSKDHLDGRPFWILGMSAFSVLASQQNLPLASQIWGLSLLFSGGFVFLFSSHVKGLPWLPFLGFISLSALPYTPLWNGLLVFLKLNIIIAIIYLLGFVLLNLGFARYVFELRRSEDEIEGWARIVYPLGLVLLPITHIMLTWYIGGMSIPDNSKLGFIWWSGALVLGIVLAAMAFNKGYYLERFVEKVQPTFEALRFTWLYKTIGWVLRIIRNILSFFSLLLEGDGGVLWSILIMILLISIIINH